MENLPKLLESDCVVRFADCDPFGHLNNARYIDYFINAREDQLLKYYNFSPYQLVKEQGVAWVITTHQIAYLRPALCMERVGVRSFVSSWGKTNLRVEMSMWDEKRQSLKALLWTEYTHYDLKAAKRVAHSDELCRLFGQVENPLPPELRFDQRIRQLKQAAASVQTTD